METSVKTYGSARDYERGLAAMHAQGWASVNVVEKRPVRGCLALFPARSELIVTYEREAARNPIQDGICPRCRTAISPAAYYCPTCRLQLRD